MCWVALCTAAAAQTPATPMMTALRAQDWAAADTLALQDGDPALATRLVQFIRLLKPGQATASEIADFLKAHPAWPDADVLHKRLGEGVVSDPDDASVLPVCEAQHVGPEPLARCASAFATAGHETQASAAARSAWVGGLTAPDHADFLARWGKILTPQDEWRRFENLANGDAAAASRQVARLDEAHRLAALARLAWKHDDADALASLAQVPESLRSDPALVLENARSLRRTGALAAALALWRGAGVAAEAAVPAEARGPFWAERDSLARKLLAQGSDADASFLADDTSLHGDQALDSLFLTGWIGLRRTHDPAAAEAHFATLAKLSHSAITQGRAHYWLARALEDMGKAAEAHAEYALAAAWPTSFYGQQAALALGDEAVRLRDIHDPAWTPAQATDFSNGELARASHMLVGWGDGMRAKDFLLRLAEQMPDAAARGWAAHLALELHMPEVAVQIARIAGRSGVMLPDAGWPVPVPVPPANAALVLGIMRQESNFDAAVVSPAGAQGLMQVMPTTARSVSAGGADLFDPAANTRIGTAYLQRLLGAFPEPAEAVAAYNAGPNRVRAWLAALDPGTDATNLIDWIELIPFNETRNYVQRVLEAQAIYAAKLAKP
jgi:soluble lytic murein transglycosylase